MAALAIVALATTVIASQRALGEASEIVMRGESDLLLRSIVTDLAEETPPLANATLERTLEDHRHEGLRYVAVVDRNGTVLAEAGDATIRGAVPRPGEPRIEGHRARVAGPLFPQRRARRLLAGTMGGAFLDRHAGVATLVFEHEPPVLEALRRTLLRIGVVAGISGTILLAFAIAWSRSARRLEALESRAARDERLVALGSMSSVMAHELRNPLASLKGHAQLLVEDLEDLADARRKTKAERVVAEAERLEDLTTSLLDFVRDGPIERTPIAPADLVARALADLDASRVDVRHETAKAMLHADPMRLARALHNVVDNALKTNEEGKVELVVGSLGRDVAVSVRDHGPGIEPGTESRIFEPFVTTRVRGTGLGLAVARRIAEQHGGTLTAENHPEGGARPGLL